MSRLGLREIRKPNIKGASLEKESVQRETIANPPKVETVNKEETNGKQTVNKEETNGKLNGKQTVNSENSLFTVYPESQTETVNKRVNKKNGNGKQTVNKRVTDSCFESLRGHEANLLLLIFIECRNIGELLTPPITLEHIASELKTTKKSAKTVTHRLVKKDFIARESSGTGRCGFSRFRIAQDLYRAMLLKENSKQTVNKEVTNGKLNGKQTGKQELSSSSSIIDLEILKTTTTEDRLFDSEIQLAPEWQTVDVNPLSEIGFSQTHLIQIIRHGKLGATEVQDSIYFFAFDLKRNGKAKDLSGSPLNFFMGILRKGIPYAPPENYESPVDEARRKILEFKERKERERQAEEQRIMDLELLDWKRKLSTVEIEKLVPEYAQRPGPIQESALKSYFETQIWPILQSVDFSKNDFGLNRDLNMEPKTAEEIGKLIDQSLSGAAT